MNKDLLAIFDYMEREKGIKREILTMAIEDALHAAARKSIHNVENISVNINSKTGEINVYTEKEIVTDVKKPEVQISYQDAMELAPSCEVGQILSVLITPKDFGRIAAQTAKQVIAHKLRNAERDVIYEEYRHRENEIVSGSIKRYSQAGNLVVDLGKVEAILPKNHFPKTERYKVGERVRALLYEVRDLENGGAEVILSRSAPEFVKQLFMEEVPELKDGIVTVEKIVREAGYRTKISIKSSDPRVDPVGTCVGVRGSRVKNVVQELNNEKIDIIPFSEDPIELLQNALSPVEIKKIRANEDESALLIVVDDEHFPTVIGKRGMNARLNAQLIDKELDFQKLTEFNRILSLQQLELVEAEGANLDVCIEELEGVSPLIMKSLIDAGYNTPRTILSSTLEQIAQVPGISEDLADTIIESVKNIKD